MLFYEEESKNVINIGTGIDYSIKSYAKKMLKIILPNNKIQFYFDKSKPNVTPRKMLDVSLAKKYGWRAVFNFDETIIETYKSFLKENKKKSKN